MGLALCCGRRVEEAREQSTVTYLGAYGLVENLNPGGTRVDVNDEEILYDKDDYLATPAAIDPARKLSITRPSALIWTFAGRSLRAICLWVDHSSRQRISATCLIAFV